MANYKADSVKGWQRSFEIKIDNPYGGIPSMVFEEEFLIKAGATEIKVPCGAAGISLGDCVGKTIPLLMPVEDAPDQVIGSVDLNAFQIMLYSIYMYAAGIRDGN
jgi:hypothetical protein